MTNDATPTPTPLDDDLLAAILDAHVEDPSGAASDGGFAQRLKSRVMTRIAEASSLRHVTIKAADNTWHGFAPGIERKVLNQEGNVMSYLLRIAPGAVLPGHYHPMDEECVVISGDLRIGSDVQLQAGGFHLGRKDVPHAAITSDGGAVIYLRGALPVPELLI